MATKSLTLTSGLVTEPGTWSRDESSLVGATNADLSSPGIIAKRRGFSSNTINSYSGSIYSVMSSPIIERDVGATGVLLAYGNATGGVSGLRSGVRTGSFATYSGITLSASPNVRPHLTTGPDGRDIVTMWVDGGDGGPVIPDYNTHTARYLGVPSGMGLDRVNTVLSGVTGFLAAAYSCRYAVTFSLGDPLINGSQTGAPGMTTVVRNTGATAANVAISVPLPKAFNTANTDLADGAYWIQVWRSVTQATSLGEPPSELALVYQRAIVLADITSGTITFTDIVPDAARGANLYTNILSGEDGLGGRGFINSNTPPPMAKDAATWADCVWLANYSDLPSQEVQLISVGAPGLVAADTFTVGGLTYTAVAGAPASTAEFQISGAGTASVNQRETALNLVDAINRRTANTACYAYYVAGLIGQPGRIVCVGRTQTSSLAASCSNASSFRIGTEDANNPVLSGLLFSKPLQPHAFPRVNSFQLGRGDAEILRIIPYRDSLFVFKEDGLWRVTGTDWATFSAQEFDLTFRLLSREAVTTLDDAIYAWGAQGIARITDGGVELIDLPIRNEVVAITNAVSTDSMANYSFAMARPREGVVLFFYPQYNPGAGGTDPGNIVPCTRAFAWFARTRVWAQWILQGDGLGIGYACGAANVIDGISTMGVWQAAVSSGAWVHNELRGYDDNDYSDPNMTSSSAPTMADTAISFVCSWRPLDAEALGAAQWLRVRTETAATDSTRGLALNFTVETTGDQGSTSAVTVSAGTSEGGAIPKVFVAPVGQSSSRAHALQVTVREAIVLSGIWLIAVSVDYRPVSTKVAR